MHPIEIIIKKRDKGELTREEIEFFVQGFTQGEIPDYQVSAWAMAILLNGMTTRETADLTLAMANSGELIDLSDVVKVAVDKHSTGGVGDKTTLVVLPVVTACGLPVGKISGRGLGFSGGTLDKMESILGYRCNLSTDEFKHQLREIGIVLTGQSAGLAPADGKLYALRDVTGTVQSIPLIASSVMSKKIAAGAQAILLDIKVGLGAFMQTLDEARQLADMMMTIGETTGQRVVPILSDMNQPLGHAVGNSLEVREAIETLHGGGPADLRDHCLTSAAHMLLLGGVSPDLSSARISAEHALDTGMAYIKFRNLVSAQGGDIAFVEDPSKMQTAKRIEVVAAPRSGYLAQVHARIIGEASLVLGAGRVKKGDAVDHAVGVIIYHKVGDFVEKGQPLFTIHANDTTRQAEARVRLLEAHCFSDEPVAPLPIYYDR